MSLDQTKVLPRLRNHKMPGDFYLLMTLAGICYVASILFSAVAWVMIHPWIQYGAASILAGGALIHLYCYLWDRHERRLHR